MRDLERDAIAYLIQALNRFDEALAVPLSNPLAIDGTIQRFEFCFELAWKAIKIVARHFGSEHRSRREAIKAAYGYNWISDETLWIDILSDRNLCSHTYREDIALAVYGRLSACAVAMRALATTLSAALNALEAK